MVLDGLEVLELRSWPLRQKRGHFGADFEIAPWGLEELIECISNHVETLFPGGAQHPAHHLPSPDFHLQPALWMEPLPERGPVGLQHPQCCNCLTDAINGEDDKRRIAHDLDHLTFAVAAASATSV